MAYTIAFFGTKPYDESSFNDKNKEFGFEIRYYKGHLNKNNVLLTQGVDAGIVSQNISIFCSAANLATVPRASMDNEQLKKVLKLKDSQMPMMNHPVGYFK